jgi:hypothetical protein
VLETWVVRYVRMGIVSRKNKFENEYELKAH